MSEKTSISWTDHTFSPWWGCVKVSPACENCYAEAWAKRTGHAVWGRNAPRRFFSDKHWQQPPRWNEAAKRIPTLCPVCKCIASSEPGEACPRAFRGCEGVMTEQRPRVFCASMADVFEDREDLTPHLARLFGLIRATPRLDWLLLTKRPENWRRLVAASSSWLGSKGESGDDYDVTAGWANAWLNGRAPHNVWMGATAENQHYADERIPALLAIPARVRFLSMEPLLGPVDILWGFPRTNPVLLATMVTKPAEGINWIIVGGESGGIEKRRPFEIAWLESIAAQCDAASVPLHVKQDAGPKSGEQGRIPDALWNRKEFPDVARLSL